MGRDKTKDPEEGTFCNYPGFSFWLKWLPEKYSPKSECMFCFFLSACSTSLLNAAPETVDACNIVGQMLLFGLNFTFRKSSSFWKHLVFRVQATLTNMLFQLPLFDPILPVCSYPRCLPYSKPMCSDFMWLLCDQINSAVQRFENIYGMLSPSFPFP